MQIEKVLIEAFCITSMIITSLELMVAKLDNCGTGLERLLTTLERLLIKISDVVKRWRS